MISAHLPALQVVLPLVAAPLCVLLGRGALAWALAVAVSWIAFGIAGVLLYSVLTGGDISYPLGNWPPPWGIEYRIDVLNAFILVIVSGIAAVVLPYARISVRREIPARQHHLFYCLFVLCLTGLLGITITGDLFNVFVFLEISSLSSYALISMGSDRKALTAAFQYLVMGTIGATFILIGIGLLYMMTGTLNMADLADRVVEVDETAPVLAAFAFIVVGAMLKLALFPLHLWLPNAYAFAPSAVTAFIAATATKVSIYVLLRVVFTIFGAEFAFGDIQLGWVLFVPALLAVFAGSSVAIFQLDVKRMLAYSSIAQIGYIVLGISLTTAAGLTAGILHIFNHALIKAGLFCVMGCVFFRLGTVRIEAMAGLAREMPLTMAAFVIGGMSLIGIPATAGFISKWYLVEAVLELGQWWLAALILLSALLTLVYVWRVVEAAYFKPPPLGRKPVAEAPLALLIPTWVLTLANIYFGIDTWLPVEAAQLAAGALLGVD